MNGLAQQPAVAPIWINTKWAVVSVYGHELVSKKELLCIAKCLMVPQELEAQDHRVRSIIIRDDGYPKSKTGKTLVMATSHPDSGALTLNLEANWNLALKLAKKQKNVSVLAVYHQNLLLNVLHEINHLQLIKSVDTLTAQQIKEKEACAETWAAETLKYLAKHTDLEMDHPANSKYLGKMFMSEIKVPDAWTNEQRYMLDNHIYYNFESKSGPNVVAMSFKKFICLIQDHGEHENPEWNVQTLNQGADPMESCVIDMTKVAGQYVAVQTPGAIPTAADYDVLLEQFKNVVPDPPVVAAAPQAIDPETFFAPAMSEVDADVERRFGNHAPLGNPTPVSPVATAYAQPNMSSFPTADDSGPVAEAVEYYEQEAPAEVMAAAPVFQPAQAMAQPAPMVQPIAQAAAPAVASPDVLRARDLAFSVFTKCYNHIFTYCGQTAEGFNNPKAVITMPITLTQEEASVITHADYKVPIVEEDGTESERWSPNCSTSNLELRGLISRDGKIPYYQVHFTFNGQRHTRVILPQNPMTNSKPALEAQAGARIMYVKDKVTNAWLYKIINGTWMEG